MASPNPMKKAKWPSQKKQSGTDVADFVPYVSNLVNSFRKTPRPIAPKSIDPVTGTSISLADARRQVSDSSRAADLSTENLDAQTGAAIRVGNMGTRFRALSDLNSKEAQMNAQMGNQTKYINANIDSQNAQMTNQYHDDITNAEIAQQRVQSENISNAADKYITQRAVKDQYTLDKEKTNILSKMYNPGVYSRLQDSINGKTNPFAKYQNMQLPAATSTTSPTTVTNTGVNTGAGPLISKSEGLHTLPDFMRRKDAPQYFMQQYAAGGMLKVFGDDPKPKVAPIPSSTSTTGASNDMIFADPMTRNARMADALNRVIANGFHPYNSEEGKAAVSQASFYHSPQFASDFTTRAMQVQGEPGYNTMTPEQRINRYYSLGHSNSELDQFLKQTSSYGGNPSAFYQNSPMKAFGGKVKRYGGKIVKPFA